MCNLRDVYRHQEGVHRFVWKEGVPESPQACPAFDAAKERKEAQEKLPQDPRQQINFLARKLQFLQEVAVCQPENQAVHKLYQELWKQMGKVKGVASGVAPAWGWLAKTKVDANIALHHVGMHQTIAALSKYLENHPALGCVDQKNSLKLLENGNAAIEVAMLFPELFWKAKGIEDFYEPSRVTLRIEIDRDGRVQSINFWKATYRGKPTVFAPFIGKRIQELDMKDFRQAVRADAKNLLDGEFIAYAGSWYWPDFYWESDTPNNEAQLAEELAAEGKTGSDAAAYERMRVEDNWLNPGSRYSFRRCALAWMNERGAAMNPMVKARMMIDLAASYLAESDTYGLSKDYNPQKAFSYADQALKILQQDGVEKQMPKEFSEVTREGMILYCLYLRAHALRQEGKVDVKTVIRAYKRGLDMYRDAAKNKEGWVRSRAKWTFSNIANELVRVMLKNGQEKEAKALYDELEKENLYVTGATLAEHAKGLAERGKVREARALYPEEISEWDVERFIEMKEWKTVMTPQERRDRLKEFFQDKREATMKRFEKKYPQLSKNLLSGKKTPWDFVPNGGENALNAYWRHIEGTLWHEDDPKKAQDHYLAALDMRPARLKPTILRDLHAAVVREFIQEEGAWWRGTEQGEKVTFADDGTAGTDTTYLWMDARRGIAVEKYFKVRPKKGVTIPTSRADVEIEEKGRMLKLRANDYGRVELQKPGTGEWHKVIETAGMNKPLYMSPFTKEITTKTPAEEMAEKIQFPDGWMVWTKEEGENIPTGYLCPYEPLGWNYFQDDEYFAKFYYRRGTFWIEEPGIGKKPRGSHTWPGFQEFFNQFK